MAHSKEIWAFASYNFQGNPKALFLYMRKYHPEVECRWVADEAPATKALRGAGVDAVWALSDEGRRILRDCDVLVVENVRVQYPEGLNPDATVVNLWHGVGIKRIECLFDEGSTLYREVAKKHIRNARLLHRNQVVLATSEKMEQFFRDGLRVGPEQIIRGPYPRNLVYLDPALRSTSLKAVLGARAGSFRQVGGFAPTWRGGSQEGVVKRLLPDMDALQAALAETGTLLILKMHPFIERSAEYRHLSQRGDLANILFWPEGHDIYEVFGELDFAIVDYSSIFYDMLEAGMEKFIRYVPDHEEHLAGEGLVDDYFANTGGEVVTDFAALLDSLSRPVEAIADKEVLLERFFGYSLPQSRPDRAAQHRALDALIDQARAYVPPAGALPTLYTFDVFDTLLRRKSLEPLSVFHGVRQRLAASGLGFGEYFTRHYVEIRRESEADTRAFMRSTVESRGDTRVEVTFEQIFDRIRDQFDLTEAQVAFLKTTEIELEFSVMEPHPYAGKALDLVAAGETVLLISDMYLPKSTITELIRSVNPALAELPLVLSSEVGHKKDSGRLYLDTFYKLFHGFGRWVHLGDNYTADGVRPARLEIEARCHDIDAFTDFETALIEANPTLDMFKAATLMQRHRWRRLDRAAFRFGAKRHFGYAYAGAMLVPYVDWALRDALERGYEVLYFISRDGYHLKAIADTIIAERGLAIETRYIYGSRKVWRATVDPLEAQRVFQTTYGPFGGTKTMEQVAAAAELPLDELLALAPGLRDYAGRDELTAPDRKDIAATLASTPAFIEAYVAGQERKKRRALSYLEQNIELDRKFAFVEYFGRGVTQDYLAGFLADLAGREVETPFYYVRSIWGSSGASVRHRFTHLSYHFSFVEPIFETTPYRSIARYVEAADGRIEPEIVAEENAYHADFDAGLREFARDFCRAGFDDAADTGRALAESTYRYFREAKGDQFLCDVYAELPHSVGTYEDLTTLAPKLTAKDIDAIVDVPLRRVTRDIGLSLARSSASVRKRYLATALARDPAYELPPARKPEFPARALSGFHQAVPGSLLQMRQEFPYRIGPQKRPGAYRSHGSAGDLVAVDEIHFSQHGVPVALAEEGHVDLAKAAVHLVSEGALAEAVPVWADLDGAGVGAPAAQLAKGHRVAVEGVVRGPDGKRYLATDAGFVAFAPRLLATGLPLEPQYVAHDVRRVLAKRLLHIYPTKRFGKLQRQRGQWYLPGAIIRVAAVEWTSTGVPRIRTERGYVTANLGFVRPLG